MPSLVFIAMVATKEGCAEYNPQERAAGRMLGSLGWKVSTSELLRDSHSHRYSPLNADQRRCGPQRSQA